MNEYHPQPRLPEEEAKKEDRDKADRQLQREINEIDRAQVRKKIPLPKTTYKPKPFRANRRNM